MDLLAGTKAAGEGALSDAHTQMIQDMTRVFEAQRLVSLDTILHAGGPSGSRGSRTEAG